MRRAVIRRDGGRCRVCSERGLEVHHIHYDNVGRESPEELVYLCQPCHVKEHKYKLEDREEHWRELLAQHPALDSFRLRVTNRRNRPEPALSRERYQAADSLESKDRRLPQSATEGLRCAGGSSGQT